MYRGYKPRSAIGLGYAAVLLFIVTAAGARPVARGVSPAAPRHDVRRVDTVAAAKPQKTPITTDQATPWTKRSATRKVSRETTTKTTRDETTANMLLPISALPARHALPYSGIASRAAFRVACVGRLR